MRFKPMIITVYVALFLIGSMPSFSANQLHSSLIGPHKHITQGDSIDVWVFFNDRGYEDENELNLALFQAEKNLLPKTKSRRLKVRPNSLVDERDLPVNQNYVGTILDMGGRFRTVSRYFNAASVRVHQDLLIPISELAFVKKVRPIAKGNRNQPDPDWSFSQPGSQQPDGTDELDYGPSYDQLNQINAIAAHDSGYSGNGVLVCLLDTGFFTDHEALINQPVVAEWDFINNDPETQNEPGDPEDQHNHGTYTFSALGGAHDGDLYGPAYGAEFLLGKTENVPVEEPIEEDWYVAGLEWADSIGADIVSTSLGYFDWYEFEDLDGNTAVTTVGVDIAVANGIVCVTAAGNERQTSWGHIIAPADADSVITVGAVDQFGVLVYFSSPGPTADGRIKPEGACALILEAHPDWTPMQVRLALMMTADNATTPDNDYGWGVIDVMAAIDFNFPPYIIAKDPLAGTLTIPQDSTQNFWVSAVDFEGDPMVFTWLVDGTVIASGSDTTFSYSWNVGGIYTVMVLVADSPTQADTAVWEVNVESLGIGDENDQSLPTSYALYGNFPNPFNPKTAISYQLPAVSFVNLAVYDISGRKVTDLVNGSREAGVHEVIFDALNLTSGIYLYRLEAGEFTASGKMVLMK